MKEKKRTKFKKLFKKLKKSKHNFAVVNRTDGHTNIVIDCYPLQMYTFDATGMQVKRIMSYDTTYSGTLSKACSNNCIDYIESHTKKCKNVIKDNTAYNSNEYSNSTIGFKIN